MIRSFDEYKPIEHKGFGAAGYCVEPSVFIKERHLVYRLSAFDMTVTVLGLIPALGVVLSVITFLRDIFFTKKMDFSLSPLSEDLEKATFSTELSKIASVECYQQTALYSALVRTASFFPIINLFTPFYYVSRAVLNLKDGKKQKISFLTSTGASELANSLKLSNPELEVRESRQSFVAGILRFVLLAWIPALMTYAFFDPLLVRLGIVDKSIIAKQDFSDLGTLALFGLGFYLPLLMKVVASMKRSSKV